MIRACDIAHRRRRLRRCGAWISGAVFLSLAGLWGISKSHGILCGVPTLGGMIVCRSGSVCLLVNCRLPPGPDYTLPYSPYESSKYVDLEVHDIPKDDQVWLSPVLWRVTAYVGSPVGSCQAYYVAMWPIMLPFLASFLYFSWAARRAVGLKDRCVVCGYNLAKNVSGVCPECGTAFRDVHEIRRQDC